jgi:DNA-binding GntR family transcriptional regulator
MSINYPLAAGSAPTTKTDRVYQQLLRRIRTLQIAPGTPLRKKEIAIEFRVSRAPIGEAISRLAAAGLVEIHPQSGSFVTPLRQADIRDAMFIRVALETEAIKSVSVAENHALISMLEENIQDQASALECDSPGCENFYVLDTEFHSAIVAAMNFTATAELLDITQIILDRPRNLNSRESLSKQRCQAAYVEHCRILDAIKLHDATLSEAAMRLHLRNASIEMDRWITQLETNRNH